MKVSYRNAASETYSEFIYLFIYLFMYLFIYLEGYEVRVSLYFVK